MIIHYIAGVGVALIGFFIQIRPRLKNRYFGIDTWRHLLVADYIRENKHYPRAMPDNYLIDKPSDYPPLFRYILAVLPKVWLEKNQWLVSPFFDMLHNYFLFIIVYMFTGQLYIALLAQISYMLSPIVIMENSNLTTRSFASFIFSISLVALLFYDIYRLPLLLIVSLTFIVILLLSHRMSIQALFFSVIILSLWRLSLIYIGIFIGAIILACIVSKGFYLKVLRGHIGMIKFWFEHIENRYAHQIRGVSGKEQKNPDAVFRIYQLVQDLPFAAVVAANPFTLFVIAFILNYKFAFIDINYYNMPSEFVLAASVWSAGLFVVGLIIRQIKKLGCVGEGERYLEYTAFPTALVASLFVYSGLQSSYSLYFIVVFLIFAFCFSYLPAYFIQQQVIVKDKKRSVNSELREIFSTLNGIEGDVNLMTIPLYLADSATYFTKARLLTTDNSIAHITDYSDFWPVLKKPIDEVFDKYGINYLLLNTDYVSISELKIASYKIVDQHGPYKLLEV